jgi:hypothetical protein
MREERQVELNRLISYSDFLGLNGQNRMLDFLHNYCIGGDKNDIHQFSPRGQPVYFYG